MKFWSFYYLDNFIGRGPVWWKLNIGLNYVYFYDDPRFFEENNNESACQHAFLFYSKMFKWWMDHASNF